MTLSIKTKLILAVIATMSAGGVAITRTVERLYESNVHKLRRQSLDLAREGLANLEAHDIQTLSAVLLGLSQNERYQELFKAGNRDGLYQEVAPLFAHLKSNFGITHWYFHLPGTPGTTFLRVHAPKKYDDAVKRETYRQAVRTGDFGAGKELGKTAFALRVVYPWKDRSGKLIGYLELGEEIDHFAGAMKRQTGLDFALIVRKDHLNAAEWAAMRAAGEQRDNWPDKPATVLVGSTFATDEEFDYDGDTLRVPDAGEELAISETPRGVLARGIVPLRDATGAAVGGVYVARNITAAYTEMRDAQQNTIVVVVVAVAVLSAIIIFALVRLVFRRLAHTTRVLMRVMGGDYTTRVEVKAEDEIGKFESMLEAFRQLFATTVEDASCAQRAAAAQAASAPASPPDASGAGHSLPGRTGRSTIPGRAR